MAADWPQGPLAASGPAPSLDTSVPHIARVYDYWLGGKDNFAVDREAAEQVIAAYPGILRDVRAQRAFLANAVRYLAGVAGIGQFLDIGTGIPTANNTHEVAQGAEPSCRVVYVDNDPLVLAHARALLVGTTAPTAYVDADLRDTGTVLAQAAQLLDFTKPVAVMLISVLNRGGQPLQPAGPGERHAAHPGRDLALLRRPGATGTRPGPNPPMAARPVRPRPQPGGSRLLRSGPQSLTRQEPRPAG